MPQPTRSEILKFIAANEPLEKTLEAFPGLTREKARALLREAAILVRAEEEGVPEQQALPSIPERAPEPNQKKPVPSAADVVVEAPPEASLSQRKRLRVYSDGAARGNPGPAGAGAVLMKPDGAIVAKVGKFLGAQTNNYAEYTALLLGLETAIRLGANEVEVYADSELMIRQLEGRYKLKAEGLKPLYAKAKELLGRFAVVKLTHVPREQNKLADEMSNRAIDEEM